MKQIAVFFGGRSVEHDISIVTGVMTVNSINKEKYQAIPVYVCKTGAFYTGEILRDLDAYKNLDFKKLTRLTLISGDNVLYAIRKNKLKAIAPLSAAINCMHGERGEDGTLSALLKSSDIPNASPDIMASAVSMDKEFSKIALKGLGIKTVSGVSATSETKTSDILKKLSLPLIVKPTTLGSSIGIRVAKTEEELKGALLYALKFSRTAIVEQFLTGFKEINCSAYCDKSGKVILSECEEPVRRGELLSFDDKYLGGKRVFPARIDREISNKIKRITEKIYKKFKFSGVIRIDFFFKDGEVLVNEINAVPGSLAYYLFGDTLKSFSSLLDTLIESALYRFAQDSTLKTDYQSGILKMGGSKGGKGR